MNITKRQVVLDNKEITLYQLYNDKGMMVEAMNLGGIITKIMTEDKDGKFENVVLEWQDLNTYIENPGYFGAIIGRTAGRIHKAQVTIDNNIYTFPQNDNANSIHGGITGFDKKIWECEEIIDQEEVTLKLKCVSEDGEEGYPGQLDVVVYYKLNNSNEFTIRYEATTNKTTLVNLTQHTYFNLSGDAKRSIEEQEMFINSDKVCEIDHQAIPTGNLIDLSTDSIFNFKNKKLIGQDINKEHIQLTYAKGYDHPWLLNEGDLAAQLYDPISKRSMEIRTNQEAVVVYTMNHPNENKLTNGNSAPRRYAVCFETQAPPIGYNEVNKELSLLKPENKYYHETTFAFKVK